MLEAVLNHLNNWFDVRREFGTFTVTNGSITLPFLQRGQYFRIVGSVFNDGLYQYPANDLTSETFDGAVWALAIPKAVISLTSEIETWQEKNGGRGQFQSESFGGYSYSLATDSVTGGAITWESAFRSRLDQWRKI